MGGRQPGDAFNGAIRNLLPLFFLTRWNVDIGSLLLLSELIALFLK